MTVTTLVMYVTTGVGAPDETEESELAPLREVTDVGTALDAMDPWALELEGVADGADDSGKVDDDSLAGTLLVIADSDVSTDALDEKTPVLLEEITDDEALGNELILVLGPAEFGAPNSAGTSDQASIGSGAAGAWIADHSR